MHIGILVMLACHGCEPLLLITIEGDRCDDGPCAMFVSEFLQDIFRVPRQPARSATLDSESAGGGNMPRHLAEQRPTAPATAVHALSRY